MIDRPRLYPEIEPYDHGMLEVGDGNLVYWETCGDPGGKPALVLHGGPGSGCTPSMRRYLDPARYRIALFDQRGCGRSTPHAGDPTTDLSVNTTEHLLGDIERLRRNLRVDRWLVFGVSWGSTLGLCYAERHPERVTEVLLACVATTRRSEVDWLTRGLGRLFPEEWARFRDGLPEEDRGGDLAEAYSRRLDSSEPAVREQAARDWCEWEDALVRLEPDQPPNPRYSDPRFRMAFARLVTHYFRHAAWIEDGALLRGAERLGGIPGVLVHGRLDFGSPLITAWELAQAWPGCELVVVDGAGHSILDRNMLAEVVVAGDRLARRT